MKEWQKRTAILVGEDSVGVLALSKVAVFGLGGVGSYAVEALARAGVGSLTLVDSDEFDITNINRQLYALHSTVGMAKCDVSARRVAEINPECVVTPLQKFLLPDNIDEFDLVQYDYVLDCIDTVSAKLALAVKCDELGVKLISAMGAGNKLHPELFEVADISKTSVCPLAKVMRRELRLRGINHLKVVYSKEEPIKAVAESGGTGRHAPGSVSFVPSAMGIIMAGEVIRDLTLPRRSDNARVFSP